VIDSLLGWWRGRKVVILLAAVLSVVLLGGAWMKYRPAAAPGLTDLVAAVGERRMIEPRLTGGFGFSPCTPLMEAGRRVPRSRCAPPPPPGSAEAKRLAQLIASFGAQRPPRQDSESLIGLALLVWPQGGSSVERAVAALESTAERNAGDAKAQSDLAAAYSVRAVERDDPYDLVLALAAADRAVAADRLLPEAHFNRAVALEALGLQDDARRAWLDYLALDSDSGWAGEARERALAPPAGAPWESRLAELDAAALRGDAASVARLVDPYRQAARERAEQELLGLWGEAWRGGKAEEAERRLTIARAIGDALVALGGDALARDAVATIDEAAAAGDARRLDLLAAGHAAFRSGFILYKKYETDRAITVLRRARAALVEARSPFAERAAFFLACADYHRDHIREAKAALDELAQRLEGRRYSSLLGHIAWMQGLLRIYLGNGDPLLIESDYTRSLAYFQTAGDTDNVATLQSLIAESLDRIGQSRDAWEHALASARLAPRIRDPQLQFIVLNTAQRILQKDRPGVALYFLKALVQRMESAQNLLLHASALLRRGMLQRQMGRLAQAGKDFQEAGRVIRQTSDPGIRRDLEADLSLMEGDLLLERDPRKAADLLTSSLTIYGKNQNHLMALMARRARAHAFRATHQLDLAAADLLAGLKAYEKLGEDLHTEDLRGAFVARTEDIFREMISFQAVERKRDDLAFAFADRARTRVLPGAVSALPARTQDEARLVRSERETVDLRAIQSALPQGTVLIQYAALDDRLLIWLIRRDAFVPFTVPIAAPELRALAARMQSLDGGGAWKQAAQSLYEHLIRPWQGLVAAEERIVFVPDGLLDGLPFACLQDPRTGQYLLEDHEISLAPSATIYARARETVQKGEITGGPGLIVGNPAPGSRVRYLKDLPGAAAEAKRIAGLYPGSLLLSGAAATKRDFLEQARRSGWIHFAGHAVTNNENPLLSMLVLAPAAGESDGGALYAREIYELDLHANRLVVLAACDSAADRTQGGGSSLARAFLAAGVPTIVASFQRVDDRVTDQIFATFYDRLHAGDEPAAALRAAQLLLLRKGDPLLSRPSAWGAFAVIGA
jgi:CHAT domain-containing protein